MAPVHNSRGLDTTGTSPASLAMLGAGWILEICLIFGYSCFSPGLGKPAETLTLQQAQNFQQSKSSSPRSRMRKMRSGMSQRKFPGGHSASDRHVTPRHQPRVGCAGREQGGRDTGERVDHSSLSDGAAQLTLAMPCKEKFPSHVCSHPAIPKGCAALYSNPRPWQQGKGSDL